jgi:glycosyltransferase EpsH
MDCISVIIPIYNIDKYIQKCLDSLNIQTYNEYEVIMVDDGSTDGSTKICKEYSADSDRFKYIHTENHGVSHARNVGIKNAKGEFITFVDGDDYVEKDYLEKLYNALTQSSSDIAACSYYRTYDEGEKSTSVYICKEKTVVCAGAALDMICDPVFPWVGWGWGKMYRRSIIEGNSITFDEEIKMNEDSLFNVQAISVAKSVVLLNDYLYYYRIHGSSATHQSIKNPAKLYTRIVAFERILRIARTKYPDSVFERRVRLTLIQTAIHYLSVYFRNVGYDYFETKRILDKIGEYSIGLDNSHLPYKIRMRIKMLSKTPRLYYIFLAR